MTNKTFTIYYNDPEYDSFSECYTGNSTTSLVTTEAKLTNKFITFKIGNSINRIPLKDIMDNNRYFRKNSIGSYSLKQSDYDYLKKLCDNNEKVLKVESMFNDTITIAEIQEMVNKDNLFANKMKNKISFHKKTGVRTYRSIPEFVVNIKPLFDETYDKNELTNKVNAAKASRENETHEINEELKNELFEKYNVVVFRCNSYFKIGMSWHGKRDTMYKDSWHRGGVAKLSYKDYSEAKLFELAERVSGDNKDLT